MILESSRPAPRRRGGRRTSARCARHGRRDRVGRGRRGRGHHRSLRRRGGDAGRCRRHPVQARRRGRAARRDPGGSRGSHGISADYRDLLVGRGEAAGGLDRDIDTEPAQVDLTPREHQVLQLLAQGASNKAIARRLEITPHTAKFHVASIVAKLGATGRTDAVARAMRLGLVMI